MVHVLRRKGGKVLRMDRYVLVQYNDDVFDEPPDPARLLQDVLTNNTSLGLSDVSTAEVTTQVKAHSELRLVYIKGLVELT